MVGSCKGGRRTKHCDSFIYANVMVNSRLPSTSERKTKYASKFENCQLKKAKSQSQKNTVRVVDVQFRRGVAVRK
jgi:hypothetical protein